MGDDAALLASSEHYHEKTVRNPGSESMLENSLWLCLS